MSLSEYSDDRRQEPRFRCGYLPIHWCGDLRDYRRPGHMYDMSATGLAYQTLGSGHPGEGDLVFVLPRKRALPMYCQVVRVTQQGDGRYVVGCKRLEESQVLAPLGTSPPERRSRALRGADRRGRVRVLA